MSWAARLLSLSSALPSHPENIGAAIAASPWRPKGCTFSLLRSAVLAQLGAALKAYLGRVKGGDSGFSSSSEVLPSSVLRWIARTFLQQDEQEQLFLSREKQTK